MATTERYSAKKARITDEQLTEMKRLSREGKSISAIARAIGCHRQTVRMHLREKHGDIVADEVRRQVLTQELRNHFQQLVKFAQVDLKLRLDASLPEHERPKLGEARAHGPIFIGGMLGLPYPGGTMYMSKEWMRMYRPSPRESHLLQSLREHAKESSVWVHWDSWRRKVADYETASGQLLGWLEDRTEADLFEKIGPTGIELVRCWLFGNVLRRASGVEVEGLEITEQGLVSSKGISSLVGGMEAHLIVAKTADEAGSRALRDYLSGILGEAQQNPGWTILRSATAELKRKESQLELRRIAKEIDYALVSIELMHAFPGRCPLCPI